MGKKFISLTTNATRYRLYSDDIRTVFQKPIRKLPPPPHFPPCPHPLPQQHPLPMVEMQITASSNAS
jgi:hypothetical protein